MKVLALLAVCGGLTLSCAAPDAPEQVTVRLADETIDALSEALRGEPARQTRAAQFTKAVRLESGFTPEQLDWVERHVPFGIPARDPGWDHGPTRYVAREGYVLEHSSVDRIPLWVAERVDADQLSGSVPRRNPFKPDPLLPPGERAELSDYRGSGYDRGHMAPAGNQTVDRDLKDETFFLSNMTPQLGALNQRVWADLEDTVRKWVVQRGHVYIFTGGFFYDLEEDDPATADGLIECYQIGSSPVSVPTHFYKIVVAPGADGAMEAIAFVYEHRGYQSPYDHAPQIETIDWIEERTGLDFMPELDLLEADRLEGRRAAMW